MDYWLAKIKDHPVVRLAREIGTLAAAEKLGVKESEITDEILRLRYQYDFGCFSEQQLKIVNKAGELVSFVQNPSQVKMDQAIQKQVVAGKPVRLCLLKARQWGGSTKGEGHLFRESILRPHRSSMIVAHDLDSARHLRGMSERFYEYYSLPKPTLKSESDKWWKFKHKEGGRSADSSLRIETADELSGGHSLTIHNLHLSEIQNWRNAAELVKGLFPTVPQNNPDTFIFMEGTGSGVGNYWYEFCQLAMTGETEWEFLFIPWFEIGDYRLEFDSGKLKVEFEKSLDQDERLLFEKGVGLEQLLWRRGAIRDQYKNDLDAFHQQYPATPDEAFTTSGRPVFPMPKVKEGIQKSRKPFRIGNLKIKGSKVDFVDDPYGYWRLWEDRIENDPLLYCIGADVAEGLSVLPELGNRGADYSAARVLRRDTRLMVATFHARVDTDLFAEELFKASKYWNASLLPEQNGQAGGSLIANLKHMKGVRLIKTPSFGKKRDEKKDEFGWETMKNTRRMLIDDLVEEIRDSGVTDFDLDVWSEFSTFVYDDKGKAQAQSRKFDDLVFATGITIQADKLLPMHFKRQREQKRPLTRGMLEFEVKRQKKSRERVMEDTYATF